MERSSSWNIRSQSSLCISLLHSRLTEEDGESSREVRESRELKMIVEHDGRRRATGRSRGAQISAWCAVCATIEVLVSAARPRCGGLSSRIDRGSRDSR